MARAKASEGDMIKAVFVRDTLPREGEVTYQAGEVAELPASSFDRWSRRGACVTSAEAEAAKANAEAEAEAKQAEAEAEE